MRRLRVRAEREAPAESGLQAPQTSGRVAYYSSPYRKVSVRKGWLSTPASSHRQDCAPWTSVSLARSRASSFGNPEMAAIGPEARGDTRGQLLAPSVTASAQMAFPELRADRLYHQPGDDSRP